MKPTPMSIQTKNTSQPRQNAETSNYFSQQNKQFGTYQPNYLTRELNNTENLSENIDSNQAPYYELGEYCLNENFHESEDLVYSSEKENNINENPFLEFPLPTTIPPDIQEN